MITKGDKQRFLEELEKTPVVQVACQKTGIGRTSYYRLRKEDPEFAKQADKALEEGRGVVNDLGEAQTISLMKDRDMQAIRFWLTHNHPRYGNKLEITGSLMQVNVELSPEQAELLEQAVKFALPTKNYELKKTEEADENEDGGDEGALVPIGGPRYRS